MRWTKIVKPGRLILLLAPTTTMLLPTYQHFGLVSRCGSVVRPLQLLRVRATVDIVDFCAKTCIEQVFINLETTSTEIIYVFPLDERAAVCGFESEIDGSVCLLLRVLH